MNWSSQAIRDRFLSFFEEKQHKVVASAPMVIQNDPSLMFTNAGMNQFKDVFVGSKSPLAPRLVNSQKCLRVSGKHNDLEEVGVDHYHHTMFEMLGNWSFGDYFKKEAIAWAWEFLTNELGINKSDLYVTIFEGDEQDGTSLDQEAFDLWKDHIPHERILSFGKKDNFWEMGETGPCGPCSEIHVDLRSEKDKAAVPGKDLVNQDHEEVIEIWNLVFIQYHRNKEGELKNLPDKHVDTGMGLERLTRVLQGKRSNYDIDLFSGIIHATEELSGLRYGSDAEKDVAFRVIADHLRPVAFSITEGQLPSNTGPGYVIRRILRRAIRYAYSKLELRESFMFKLIPSLIETLGTAYPELVKNKELISRVIKEEEESFLRTLSQGLKRIQELIDSKSEISGKDAFELYDTYGFPLDLTQLIARENEVEVDIEGFNNSLEEQKNRSRASSEKDQSDWIEVNDEADSKFLGYDQLRAEAVIVRYRKVTEKKKSYYQLVMNQTPFYPEGGGQVGDKGRIISGVEEIPVWNTLKESDTILHFVNDLPTDLNAALDLEVQAGRRQETAKNHSATHLLHYALREILGEHVEQKGSLVHPDYLRFDFSHFEKIDSETLDKISDRVNELIQQSLDLNEKRSIPIEEAKKEGAMSLFGEKYGDQVRMISFGPSKELCGGIHVKNTREIGTFIIISESSVAAGVRRIEALTGAKASEKINHDLKEISAVRSEFNNPKDVLSSIADLKLKLKSAEKEIERLKNSQVGNLENQLQDAIEKVNGIEVLIKKLDVDPKALRDIGFKLKTTAEDRLVVLAASEANKAIISVFLSDSLSNKGKDARSLLNELAPFIDGRGGGQAFFATAGGKDPSGIEKALTKARDLV